MHPARRLSSARLWKPPRGCGAPESAEFRTPSAPERLAGLRIIGLACRDQSERVRIRRELWVRWPYRAQGNWYSLSARGTRTGGVFTAAGHLSPMIEASNDQT